MTNIERIKQLLNESTDEEVRIFIRHPKVEHPFLVGQYTESADLFVKDQSKLEKWVNYYCQR